MHAAKWKAKINRLLTGDSGCKGKYDDGKNGGQTNALMRHLYAYKRGGLIAHQKYLVAVEAYYQTEHQHLPKDDQTEYFFEFLAERNERLMLADVILESHVTFLGKAGRAYDSFLIFLLYQIRYVGHFVLQYLKLASQLQVENAEQVVETEITNSNVIQGESL